MKVWLKRSLVCLAVVLGLGVLYELVNVSAPAAAKAFSGPDLTGKQWSLADHRGRGPIILNFFGTS